MNPGSYLRNQRYAVATGLSAGLAYGLAVRLLLEIEPFGGWFLVMTAAFIFLVPGVIGFLSIAPLRSSSWPARIFLPWVSCLLTVAAAFVVGWEGTICLVMALPGMLLASSCGGILAAIVNLSRQHSALLLLLPFLINPLEQQLPVPEDYRTVTTSIPIYANRDTVWESIIAIPRIAPEEFQPRFIHWMGFPAPLAATLRGSGVGAIRHATFEGGVLFTETITEWEPLQTLSFSIRAEAADIPAVTLDEHVTVGGEYFDVLTGRYDLEPAGDHVVLHLSSQYRLSTSLNLYSAIWADFIMRSIQESILEVIQSRCEEDRPGIE